MRVGDVDVVRRAETELELVEREGAVLDTAAAGTAVDAEKVQGLVDLDEGAVAAETYGGGG